jgi:hypothetical protein
MTPEQIAASLREEDLGAIKVALAAQQSKIQSADKLLPQSAAFIPGNDFPLPGAEATQEDRSWMMRSVCANWSELIA